ncbi:MAG: SulP family inorganic anion transporter [Phototrophicaceae bacterium]
MNLYRRHSKHLWADTFAGITGGIAGAPQAMGFAILAGISPIYGLYSAFVITVLAALVSGSTFITFAPTNALAYGLGSAVLQRRDVDPVQIMVVMTFLVGLFSLVIGLLRLGRLTRFVSNAVLTGFITGTALLILLGQVSHLTGYEPVHHTVQIIRFWDWLTHAPQFDPMTSFIGVFSVAAIWGLHHTRFKHYATLITLAATSGFVALMGWDSVALVRTMAEVPRGLPLFTLPDFSLVLSLASPAFALAIIGILQSAALIQAIPNADGHFTDVSRDINTIGIANLVGSFFLCMPSCASLSRTAVNQSAGAQTRLANLISGILVGLALLFLGGVIEQITLAALAGHLIVAAASLIRLESIAMVWRVSWTGRLAMTATFITTLIAPLEYSIYLGVALSLILYIYNSASRIRLSRLVPLGNGHFREERVPKALPAHDVVILSVIGTVYFAAVRRLEELMPDPDTADHTVVILRLRDNPDLGSTGIRFMEQYAERLKQRGGRLILCGVDPAARGQMERTRAIGVFGAENIFYATDVIFESTERAYQDALAWQGNAAMV